MKKAKSKSSIKKYLRSFVINFSALYITSLVIPGMSYLGGIKTLIIATIGFSIMNLFIRPLIDLLFLPINLVTMGMFRWLVNVCVLFLLIFVIENLKIDPFTFPGFQYRGFVIPQIYISKFFSLALSSASISLVNIFLFWLAKDD